MSRLIKAAPRLHFECAVEERLQSGSRGAVSGGDFFLAGFGLGRPAVHEDIGQEIKDQRLTALALMQGHDGRSCHSPDFTRQHEVEGGIRIELREIAGLVALLRMSCIKLDELKTPPVFLRAPFSLVVEDKVLEAGDQPGAEAAPRLAGVLLEHVTTHDLHEEVLDAVLRVSFLKAHRPGIAINGWIIDGTKGSDCGLPPFLIRSAEFADERFRGRRKKSGGVCHG